MQMESQSEIRLNEPNQNIFQEYGTFEEPDSFLAQSQFILVRHALSDFNQAHNDLKK